MIPRTAYLPAAFTWAEWSRLFTDAKLWAPVVQHICRETGTATANAIEAGYPGTCAVFVVDRQVVVKIFPPVLHDFDRELEAYRLLDGQSVVPLPNLLAQGTYPDQISWPYLVLEFCPGRAIREVRGELSREDKLSVARDLGRILRAVHKTPLRNLHSLDARPHAWRAFVKKRKAACMDELAAHPTEESRQPPRLLKNVLAELPALFESVEPLVPSGFAPCLVNGDLTDDHLLLVREDPGWRISGLIDWADTCAGAFEYEWVALWLSLCGRDADMFRETLLAYDPSLRLDEAFRRRMLAYTLIHTFGPESIGVLLKGTDAPKISSLNDLQDFLWPAAISER